MSDILAGLSAALGRSYRIERELGGGGMATVYSADLDRAANAVATRSARAHGRPSLAR